MDDLSENQDAIERLSRQAVDLQSDGFLSEDDPCHEQIWNLKRQQAKLAEKAQARADELRATLDKVAKARDAIARTRDDIARCVRLCEGQKPVGGDVQAVQQQQEEFKVWRHTDEY